MTKAFPLFDDMAELCDDVIATGTGGFRATGEASSEQDANGSEEGDEEGRGGLSGSEVEQLVCLVLACVPSHFHSLSQPLKDLVSVTPANLTSKTGKRQAKELPCDSGRKPDKHQCRSGAEGLFSLSQAVESMASAFASGSGASETPAAILTSPECLTKAIQLVEEEEADWGSESLMQAVDLFQHDPRTPIAYLAFTKKELRSMWLHHQLAQNMAILDVSMFPEADTM